MRRYILDSNAVNAFVHNHEPLASKARGVRAAGTLMGTCEPIVAELYLGLQFSTTREQNTARLERVLRLIRCWPFDRAAAREFGRIAAGLRRAGRPMQLFDIMLAAVALTLEDSVVVTTDSDLFAVPGLKVANWMLPASEVP